MSDILSSLQQMLGQWPGLQEQVETMKQRVTSVTATGEAAGGMVRAEVDGAHRLRKLTIDPEALEPLDKELLEDLIVAAVNQGQRRVQEALKEELSGGLGMDLGSLSTILGGDGS